MKITIKDSEIELKTTMRAYLIYEQINNKPFQPNSLLEVLIFFYSIVLANKPEIELTFDEFVSYIDDHSELLGAFQDWIVKENEKNALFKKEDSSKKNS